MAEIKRLAIVYAEDSEDSSGQALIDLDEMRTAVRPERLSELLDDLTMACRDVLAARDGVTPFARRPR
jgi:hypothetical protein